MSETGYPETMGSRSGTQPNTLLDSQTSRGSMGKALIFSHPRCASTALLRFVAEASRATGEHEAFNVRRLTQSMPEWREASATKLKRHLQSIFDEVDFVTHIYGQHRPNIDEMIASLDGVKAIVLLYREAAEAGALSSAIAKRVGSFQKRAVTSVGVIEPEEVLKISNQFKRRYQRAAKICAAAGIPVMTLSYEQMLPASEDERCEVLRGLLSFLHEHADFRACGDEEFEPAYQAHMAPRKKINSNSTYQLVENLADLGREFPEIARASGDERPPDPSGAAPTKQPSSGSSIKARTTVEYRPIFGMQIRFAYEGDQVSGSVFTSRTTDPWSYREERAREFLASNPHPIIRNTFGAWFRSLAALKAAGAQEATVVLPKDQNFLLSPARTAVLVEEFKAMFLPIYKNGTSSFRALAHANFKEFEDRDPSDSTSLNQTIDPQDERYGDYRKFTFIRQPMDRFGSFFRDKLMTPEGTTNYEFYAIPITILMDSPISAKVAAEFISMIPPEFCDPHIKPQWLTVEHRKKLLVDRAFRLGDARALREVGIPFDLPVKLSTKGRKDAWQEDKTLPEAEAIIRKYYRRDYRLWREAKA